MTAMKQNGHGFNGSSKHSSFPQLDRARKNWNAKSLQVTLDGASLDLAHFTAIAAYQETPTLDEGRRKAMTTSVQHLEAERSTGNMIYGINIPFGAAAYTTLTQTKQQNSVDRALISLLNGDVGEMLDGPSLKPGKESLSAFGQDDSRLVMPPAWVRGAMVLRINALLRASSACRWEVCETLVKMLDKQLYPVIPIRNSISASGDLSPLAYVAYAMAGCSKVQILKGDTGVTLPADRALAEAGVTPFSFRPKEMLACINGTGASVSVAALALDRLHGLAFASNAITALMSEAMLSSPSPYDAFIHDIARPHAGQMEIAAIMRGLLKNSSLLRHRDEEPLEFIWDLTARRSLVKRFSSTTHDASLFAAPLQVGQAAPGHYLRQDRYHMRCAPQYAGPAFEELCSAHDILQVEFNSITDNPLLKPDGSVVHGGNFQASSVGLAAEKMRDVATTLGRLMHEQLLGVIDPQKNNGLPAYLSTGDPAMVGGIRSLDIASSSYLAELTFLSNRLVHLNRSAECGNQSVNSMALASARYTLQAVDLLTTMTATTLYAACQALDHRRMTLTFLSSMSEKVLNLMKERISCVDLPAEMYRDTLYCVFSTWHANWLVSLDDRIRKTVEASVPPLAMYILQHPPAEADKKASIAEELSSLSSSLASLLHQEWTDCLSHYLDSSPNLTSSIALSTGTLQHAEPTMQIHRFLRERMGIKLNSGLDEVHSNKPEHMFTSFGDQITLIAQALRNRSMDELWLSLSEQIGNGL